MQKSYFVLFCPFLSRDRADARQAARIYAAYLSHIYITQNIIYSGYTHTRMRGICTLCAILCATAHINYKFRAFARRFADNLRLYTTEQVHDGFT